MMKIGRFLRKMHRALAIPMLIFFIAKIASTGSSYEAIVMKLTEATMLLMLISGMGLYVQTTFVRKRK